MCGILGQINQDQIVDITHFERMLATIASRGPDGTGVVLLAEGAVALGHRRLSIIDLSDAGRQPMSNEDGTVWLTFNGEIYNYASLRRELEHCGHQFHSLSDSETIIHAFEEWGVECLRRLKGIFAFGVYDCRTHQLLLARDHIGVKPLYFYQSETTFIFASQPKAIIESEGFVRTIDPESFSFYLAYGNVPGDKCIFLGIKKLLPGHYLLFNGGQKKLKQYWALTYDPLVKDREEAERLLQEKIREAVIGQMVSDVPVGALLSGGLDSTILTAILTSKVEQQPLNTFTLGFEEEESDERQYARLVAEAYQTSHHESVLSYESAISIIPEIIKAYDEPFHLNGLFPMLALSQFVRSCGIKVVMGGDGGDEIFAGYLWYDDFKNKFEANNQSGIIHRILRSLRKLFMGQSLSGYPQQFFRYNGFLDLGTQAKLFGDMMPPCPVKDITLPLMQHWKPEYPPVLSTQLSDFNCFLVDHCLCKVDRASMACGLEVRVPLLDIDLVNLAFSIDHSIVYEAGERKALLKNAMKKDLPSNMDLGRKKGFSSPLQSWLKRNFVTIGKKLLLEGCLCSRGILSPKPINVFYPKAPAGVQLLLVGVELWARFWLEGDAATFELFSEGAVGQSSTKFN